MPLANPESSSTGPRPRRFALVLAASLALAVAQPVLGSLFDEDASFDVFFSLLILAVLLFVFEQRRHRRTAFSIGLAAMVGTWVGYGLPGALGTAIVVLALLAAACVFLFALCRILPAIFVKDPSWDALLGAVCGYLLLGIIWTVLYRAVETASPGSFSVPAQQAGRSSGVDRATLGYYSFITLATVGYGDVAPITPIARTLAWTEAVAGQFYLAVLVAGLVGVKVSQAINR